MRCSGERSVQAGARSRIKSERSLESAFGAVGPVAARFELDLDSSSSSTSDAYQAC